MSGIEYNRYLEKDLQAGRPGKREVFMEEWVGRWPLSQARPRKTEEEKGLLWEGGCAQKF